MYRVAGEVAVLRNVGRGLHIEMEAEAALVRFAPRLHAHFHYALAYRGLVAESCRVSNRVNHWCSLCMEIEGPSEAKSPHSCWPVAARLKPVRIRGSAALKPCPSQNIPETSSESAAGLKPTALTKPAPMHPHSQTK